MLVPAGPAECQMQQQAAQSVPSATEIAERVLAAIERVLAALRPRERELLRVRYGLTGDNQALNDAEIDQMYDLVSERVRAYHAARKALP